MVFALYPYTLMSMAELSWPEILVGNKKNDPTAWRVVTDLFSGKTQYPQKKTLDRVTGLMMAKFGQDDKLVDVFARVGEIPDGPPWAVTIAAFNAGLLASSGEPLVTLAQEAEHLENLAQAARIAISHGDFAGAASHASKWELCHQLPSTKNFVGQLGNSATLQDFKNTAAPLVAASTLYLLACWEVDFFGAEARGIEDILPLQREDQVVRPMTRWIEMAQSSRAFASKREVSDYLLSPRAASEDVDTLRRLVREWRAGEVPPKSRIPHIVSSLIKEHGEEKRGELAWKVSSGLAVVRVLDGLHRMSNEIQTVLPDYDPIGPFQDYPLMRRHAEQLKRGAITSSGGSPASN